MPFPAPRRTSQNTCLTRFGPQIDLMQFVETGTQKKQYLGALVHENLCLPPALCSPVYLLLGLQPPQTAGTQQTRISNLPQSLSAYDVTCLVDNLQYKNVWEEERLIFSIITHGAQRTSMQYYGELQGQVQGARCTGVGRQDKEK